MMRCKRIRADRGQATLETTGMLALAALLVLALVASMTTGAPALASQARAAICKVVTLGQGSCEASSPQAISHQPKDPCVLNSQSADAKVSVSFVVTGSEGQKLKVDRMSDGTYRITNATSSGASVGVGVGFDVTGTWDNDKYGASAKANAHVGLEFTEGKVYTARSREELESVMKGLMQSNVEDHLIGHGPVRWLSDKAMDLTGLGYKVPPPTSEFVEGGIEGGAGANVTAVADGAAAKISVAEGLGYQKNSDGSTVAYYQAEVKGSAQAQMLYGEGAPQQAKAAADGKAKLLTQVSRDKNGKITGVTVKTVLAGTANATGDGYAGGAPDAQGYQENTITLPIKNAQDAAVANNFLLSQGLALGGSMIYPPAAAAGAAASVPATLAFADAARDHGYVTRQNFDQDNHSYGADFDAKLLAEVGGSVQVNTNGLTATGGQYWDGTKFANWPGCGGGA
ncbi:MAG TPA: hypothetical protein VG502_08765 [Flexivirga sp.]|uniref:hypothetical protein n=1 Tax=Flexivirga sp. TaxID=1962927 RepID=UPI002C9BF5B9|nr:hypothetical protein [Flexivirga sp.]HWC22374.1 hypothetical protein [Flexivirga sp.]